MGFTWWLRKLQDIFFSKNINEDIKKRIISVLSGYVWDKNNKLVTASGKSLNVIHEAVSKNL